MPESNKQAYSELLYANYKLDTLLGAVARKYDSRLKSEVDSFKNLLLELISYSDFDLRTIDKFFANNLNVSETARQLFVHRNTLVYRIEKLEKATGLDIRVFDDALTFKIALMVMNYLKLSQRMTR